MQSVLLGENPLRGVSPRLGEKVRGLSKQGQAIVERAHQTLKIQIQKLKEGEFKYSSPHQILQHVLFVINISNTDFSQNYCNASSLVPGAIKCKTISQLKGPPLRTMEGS